VTNQSFRALHCAVVVVVVVVAEVVVVGAEVLLGQRVFLGSSKAFLVDHSCLLLFPTAMPPKKESAEAKASRLTRAAEEGMMKADRQRVALACKSPDILASVKKFLQMKQQWPMLEEPEEEVRAGPQQEEVKQAMLCSEEWMQEVDSQGFDLSACIHRNHHKWNKCPPKYLRAMLHCAEPVAMNTRLLKQLCDAGQREVPREPMLMLLEFMTGLDMAEDLPTLHLGSLVWLVMTKNEARDRRLHNAQLKAPLQWGNPKVGVYELSINKCRRGGMCEDVVLLNDRFL